jgi:hypothetical protein
MEVIEKSFLGKGMGLVSCVLDEKVFNGSRWSFSNDLCTAILGIDSIPSLFKYILRINSSLAVTSTLCFLHFHDEMFTR